MTKQFFLCNSRLFSHIFSHFASTISRRAVQENSEDARLAPSIVVITKNGEHRIGQVTKRQAVTNPENTVFSIKRLVGRKFDQKKEVFLWQERY